LKRAEGTIESAVGGHAIGERDELEKLRQSL